MAEPSPRRSRIFISYRHQEDSEHAAGRLAEDLRKQFKPPKGKLRKEE